MDIKPAHRHVPWHFHCLRGLWSQHRRNIPHLPLYTQGTYREVKSEGCEPVSQRVHTAKWGLGLREV